MPRRLAVLEVLLYALVLRWVLPPRLLPPAASAVLLLLLPVALLVVPSLLQALR